MNVNTLARTVVSTASRRAAPKQQKRSIVSWMTNYPDKVRIVGDRFIGANGVVSYYNSRCTMQTA